MTKEERRAYNRDYYARNRNQILEARKELYKSNPEYQEMLKENASKWYQDNKEHSNNAKKEYRKRQYVKNKTSEYNSLYYKKNKATINKKRKTIRKKVRTIVNNGGVGSEV